MPYLGRVRPRRTSTMRMRNCNFELTGIGDKRNKDAHETLFAVLSNQSEYRYIALLRIEEILCELQDRMVIAFQIMSNG